MTTLLTTSRDALAEAIASFETGWHAVKDCTPEQVGWGARQGYLLRARPKADALLTSGAVVDATTLPDNAALVERVTQRRATVYEQAYATSVTRATLRALAAVEAACRGADTASGDHYFVSTGAIRAALAPDADALADLVRAKQAEAWDEAVQAVAWCLDNGEPSPAAALAYVAKNNTYRDGPR